MPKPRTGEIWLVRFPFTDLSSAKVRPALIVATHRDDVVILGIFSRIPSARSAGTWVRIESSHPGFKDTGLKTTSVLRAEKLAVVHESVFQRKLGMLPADLRARVRDALKKALLLP